MTVAAGTSLGSVVGPPSVQIGQRGNCPGPADLPEVVDITLAGVLAQLRAVLLVSEEE